MVKWTAADLPNMSGQTVVVTGASSGIGLTAAREFARAGAHVVMAVRNLAKGHDAASMMTGDVEVRQLDVSDLSSIRAFAKSWTGTLDVLVNNAGVMDIPLARTKEGFDVQTATNSLGPFLLTNLLLPHLTDRVLWVSSLMHRMGHVRLDDLSWLNRSYRSMSAYSDTKLQVLLFSLELQRQLTAADSPVRSVIAHPGIAMTALALHSTSRVIYHFPFLFNDVDRGALPILFAATQDLVGDAYVGPDGVGGVKGHPKVGKPSKAALDSVMATELWGTVTALVGQST